MQEHKIEVGLYLIYAWCLSIGITLTFVFKGVGFFAGVFVSENKNIMNCISKTIVTVLLAQIYTLLLHNSNKSHVMHNTVM
jgi:hypothetical protein